MNITFGAYVQSSNHGHQGRVTGVRFLTESDREWLDGQDIQATPEQRKGVWVDILVNGGGAVMVPADTLTEVEGMEYENDWADVHFSDELQTITCEKDLLDSVK
jgi:hypothetical protein